MIFTKTTTYCGLNHKQLDSVMTIMSKLEDDPRLNLTQSEMEAFDISIQCVTEIMNRMVDKKPIEFEDI